MNGDAAAADSDEEPKSKIAKYVSLSNFQLLFCHIPISSQFPQKII